MVGIIHKVLFDLIESAGGPNAVEAVRSRAGIPADAAYSLNAAYDDAEWRRLLEASCAVLGLSAEAAELAYAEAFYRDALTRWPSWFQMSRDSREFLLRQPAIHNSLAAGLTAASERKAVSDKFRVERNEGGIIMHYRSPNQHCRLYVALARRIIAHYGDDATIAERCCMRTGAPECEIHVQWTRFAAQG